MQFFTYFQMSFSFHFTCHVHTLHMLFKKILLMQEIQFFSLRHDRIIFCWFLLLLAMTNATHFIILRDLLKKHSPRFDEVWIL